MHSASPDLADIVEEAVIPESPPWRWIVAAWALFSVLAAGQMRFDQSAEISVGRVFSDLSWAGLGWSFWLLAAPLVLVLGRRFPLSRGLVHHLIYHLGFCLTLAAIHAPLFALVTSIFEPYGPTDDLSFGGLTLAVLSWSAHAEIAIYWAILGGGQAVAHRRRARERERRADKLELQLADARLETLRAQLRPHFLFNALNTIAMLARQQRSEEVVETTAALGELLRATLGREAQTVDLAAEIDLVRLYLEIEKIRFADRLQTQIIAPPELLAVQVPSLLLQPLVENAIRHGLAHLEGSGALTVEARRRGENLELRVSNDGPPPLESLDSEDEGIGLGHTRARLSQLYGAAAELQLQREAEKTVARLQIPIAGGTW